MRRISSFFLCFIRTDLSIKYAKAFPTTFQLYCHCTLLLAFSALMLLVGRQERHPACKELEWWGAGMVICLERGADLHTVQPS